MKCDCKGCTDRQVGCHSWCERYLQFKQELNDRNQLIQKMKDQERILDGVRIKRS